MVKWRQNTSILFRRPVIHPRVMEDGILFGQDFIVGMPRAECYNEVDPLAKVLTIVTRFAGKPANFELVRFVPYIIRIRTNSVPICEFRVSIAALCRKQ
ncbi:hypothetical protein Hanom_Chr08g00711621 [Helianthus anomalus]